MNLPSIKTLSQVFGDNAKEARRILEARPSELKGFLFEYKLEGWERRFRNPPSISHVRLAILDRLAETHGVEGVQVKDGSWCDYLNTGETYAPTLVYFRERYRVVSWGDIVERHGSYNEDY